MGSAMAAGYVGEVSVEAFLSRVGSEYPGPVVAEGRRRLWLKRDLDHAIGNATEEMVADAADIL
ncbi:hypothetical protein DLJ53_21975 [Acuticoccus sediminis]|uniref:Uncharacterized protein n=2 Tax=Acuticoccus sediminis TaxID=2184697 RepID=A0A8B2NU94_9HYPH|nr:hypothetical protein DLJ53_21975 [Acuticoccus sediminis]